MAELVAIVPSRGRPGTVRPLVEAFDETCTADTMLVFTVDASGPRTLLPYTFQLIPAALRFSGMMRQLYC